MVLRRLGNGLGNAMRRMARVIPNAGAALEAKLKRGKLAHVDEELTKSIERAVTDERRTGSEEGTKRALQGVLTHFSMLVAHSRSSEEGHDIAFGYLKAWANPNKNQFAPARRWAALYIGKLRPNAGTINELTRLTTDAEADVRGGALEGLEPVIGLMDVQDRFLLLSHDIHPEVRKLAVEVMVRNLDKFKDKAKLMERLTALLSDPNEKVKALAKEGLGKLGK